MITVLRFDRFHEQPTFTPNGPAGHTRLYPRAMLTRIPRIFAAYRNEYSGLSMLRSFPTNLKNRQREPLVTQPYTAGNGVPSLSLNNWIATISAAHWPSPPTISSLLASTTAMIGA